MARRGRTADSKSKKCESNMQGFYSEILAVLAARNAKNIVSCMGQAHTSDTLTVLVIARYEMSARRLAPTEGDSTHR